MKTFRKTLTPRTHFTHLVQPSARDLMILLAATAFADK